MELVILLVQAVSLLVKQVELLLKYLLGLYLKEGDRNYGNDALELLAVL